LTFDEAVLAGIAYRRSGMTWREIGHHLGFDKDRLRKAAIAQGYADGWGDSPILQYDSSLRTDRSGIPPPSPNGPLQSIGGELRSVGGLMAASSHDKGR
jgi:hypothetical protein